VHRFWCLACIHLSVACQTAPASTAETEGGENPRAGSETKIVPWLEVNAPEAPLKRFFPEQAKGRPPMSMIDYCLEGVEHWAKITDIVIVSTRPGKVTALYPELMRRKPPSLFIIGGLKTYILAGTSPKDPKPYDFADPEGWRRIAEEGVRISRITGTDVILLDNEVALGAYHRGEATIDYDKLATSLEALRQTGLQFWWYLPLNFEDDPRFPTRKAETLRLVRTIADAVPRSIFSTGFTAWYEWERNLNGEVDHRQAMIDLVGLARIQERLFVTEDGWMTIWSGPKRCHTPLEALALMRQLPGDVFIVYPGGSRWVSTSKAYDGVVPTAPRGDVSKQVHEPEHPEEPAENTAAKRTVQKGTNEESVHPQGEDKPGPGPE